MTSVVLDAGPRIALTQLEHLDLLRALFDEAAIPPVVVAEVAPTSGARPGGLRAKHPTGHPSDPPGRPKLHGGELHAP